MSDSPKRILHVFARMDRGGAETRIMEVYRNLDRNEIQFDFINLDSGVHHYDQEIKKLGGRKFIVRHPRKSGVFAHSLDLYRIMKNAGPYQAVHAHTAHHEGVVALVSKIAGIKYRVCHARTTSSKNINSVLKRLSIAFGRRLILNNATSLLSISKAAGEYLFGERAMKQGLVQVVPNAVDLIPYKEAQEVDTNLIRNELNIPNCELLIGHVGRFSEVKNHQFLIKLVEHLRTSNIDAHLILVGGGELRPKIEKQVANCQLTDYVHFLGVCENIPQLMKLFDVFVMPSIYEGLGGAAIEAQAAGIPCVLSSSLPDEVDMGVGLVQFVSLDCQIEVWKNTIMRQSQHPHPEYLQIKEKFHNKGFLIENEIESFLRAYGIEKVGS